VADSIRLSFNGLEGRRYAVDMAPSPQGPFTTLAEMMTQLGGTVVFEPITQPGRFYRVRPLP
jgi:hypothetical protein